MAFDAYTYDFSDESAQPADPTIDPVNYNGFLLPFSFDEHAIEPEAAQIETAGQQPFFPDFLEDDIYLEAPFHDKRSSDDTYNDGAGLAEGWTQPKNATQDDISTGQLATSSAPAPTRSPDAGAHQIFAFDTNMIDPALLSDQMQLPTQTEQMHASGTAYNHYSQTPFAPNHASTEPLELPSLSPGALTRVGLHSSGSQPPLLDTLRARFEASNRARSAGPSIPSGAAFSPPSSAPQMMAAMPAAPLQASKTSSSGKATQKTIVNAMPASHFQTPTMQATSMSQSPALPGTPLRKTMASTPAPTPQKPLRRADRRDMPRIAISTNALLINGDEHAKKLAIQRVPLRVQQDDSEQVANNAQYWVPAIANAFDVAFQAQPDCPDEYTEAGLAEWTRWQKEHDDKVQAVLHANPQPQALVQACAFLFLYKVLEAHNDRLGPVAVPRTVAVGGSNPHLKCSDRLGAAIAALEKFPIVRYDLVRVERLAEFAANPKGFGERKVENLWINYGKKKNQAPHLKRELPMQSETLAPSAAPGIMQSLTPDGKSPANAHRPTPSGTLGGIATTSTPRPTASSSPGMMRPTSHPADQRTPPHPALMQLSGMQNITHTLPKATPRAQQAMMSISLTSKQPQQISPSMPGMMKAGSRHAMPQTAAMPGSSVVGIGVDSTGRANVLMSEKAIGKKRKVEDLGADYSGELDVRGGKRCG